MRIKTSGVENLKDEFLYCLLLGHEWDDPPIVQVKLENGLTAWKQDLTCLSCESERYDTFEPETFALWRRHYWHFPGYGLVEPYTKADLRMERSRRGERKRVRKSQRLKAVR